MMPIAVHSLARMARQNLSLVHLAHTLETFKLVTIVVVLAKNDEVSSFNRKC